MVRKFSSALALATLVFFTGCLSSNARQQKMINDAIHRTVVVQSSTGYCAGFILVTDRVLTAKHCKGNNLRADGQQAEILKEAVGDSMLLEANTPKFPLIQANLSPKEGEETHEVFIHAEFGRLVSFGRIMQVNRSTVRHNTLHIPGFSGSALLDSRGRLIGVNANYYYTPFPVKQTITMVMGGVVMGRQEVTTEATTLVMGEAISAKAILELLAEAKK